MSEQPEIPRRPQKSDIEAMSDQIVLTDAIDSPSDESIPIQPQVPRRPASSKSNSESPAPTPIVPTRPIRVSEPKLEEEIQSDMPSIPKRPTRSGVERPEISIATPTPPPSIPRRPTKSGASAPSEELTKNEDVASEPSSVEITSEQESVVAVEEEELEKKVVIPESENEEKMSDVGVEKEIETIPIPSIPARPTIKKAKTDTELDRESTIPQSSIETENEPMVQTSTSMKESVISAGEATPIVTPFKEESAPIVATPIPDTETSLEEDSAGIDETTEASLADGSATIDETTPIPNIPARPRGMKEKSEESQQMIEDKEKSVPEDISAEEIKKSEETTKDSSSAVPSEESPKTSDTPVSGSAENLKTPETNTPVEPKKARPPVPKKTSSKIAAFQQMFNQPIAPNPAVPNRPKRKIFPPVDTTREEREIGSADESPVVTDKPSIPKRPSKLSSNFVHSLNGMIGMALPGMAAPIPEPPSEDKENDGVAPPISDVRRGRARGPKGRKLPTEATAPVPEGKPKFGVFVSDTWAFIQKVDSVEEATETETESVAPEATTETFTAVDEEEIVEKEASFVGEEKPIIEEPTNEEVSESETQSDDIQPTISIHSEIADESDEPEDLKEKLERMEMEEPEEQLESEQLESEQPDSTKPLDSPNLDTINDKNEI